MRKILLVHWRNRARSHQVHVTTLLFCPVKSTIHSWDIPPLPNAQMLPPDLADEVKIAAVTFKGFQGALMLGRQEWTKLSNGAKLLLRAKNAEGGFCGNHFLFTYTVAFIHEPYNIFMCPLKAGGGGGGGAGRRSILRPLRFLWLTRPHRQAGRPANRYVCFLLLGRDLRSFAGYGVLHSFQLLQQLLAARERVARLVGARAGGRSGARDGRLERRRRLALPGWFGGRRQRTFSEGGGKKSEPND